MPEMIRSERKVLGGNKLGLSLCYLACIASACMYPGTDVVRVEECGQFILE